MVMVGKNLVIETLKLSRNFWRKMIYSLGKRNGGRGVERKGEMKRRRRGKGIGTESRSGPRPLRARIAWKPAGPRDFLYVLSSQLQGSPHASTKITPELGFGGEFDLPLTLFNIPMM